MLPGRRRLQQGTRNSPAANRSRASATRPDGPVELPAYQPQACPLNPEALSLLRHLNQTPGSAKLDTHIRESLALLGASTAALNATLQSSRYQVSNISEKKEAEKARLEEEVRKLEEVTKALTGDAEEAVRGLVDMKAEVEDEKQALQQTLTVSDEAVTRRQRERAERIRQRQERAEVEGNTADADASVEDEVLIDEKVDVKPLSALVKERKQEAAAKYEELSSHRRYALNNDYADFKRQWHNGLHGEDAVLPDAKRWFSSDGHPIFNFGKSNGGTHEDDADMDGDTDLIVERATISTRCPLSLQEMSEPYANRRCKHVFEKAAIMEFIGRQGRAVVCPQSGCNAVGAIFATLARTLAANESM